MGPFIFFSAIIFISCLVTTTSTGSVDTRCIFVTGGSGFLGRNVIRHFVAKGVRVHAIGRSAKSLATLASLGAIPFPGDLGDVDSLVAAARGCRALLHCAADVRTSGDLQASLDSNVRGTDNAFAAARAAGVRVGVHVGTEAAMLLPSGEPLVDVDERDMLPFPPFPGIYSHSKNFAERAALNHDGTEMRVSVVRPRFIWGGDDSVILPKLIEATKDGTLMWFDGGGYLTSHVHVLNAVAGIEAVMERGAGGEAYYITDGAPTKFKEFISEMLKAVSVDPPTSSVPLKLVWGLAWLAETICYSVLPNIAFTSCQPPVDRQSLALIGQQITVLEKKARTQVGFENAISVEEGMADLRARYLRSSSGLKLDAAPDL